MGTNRIPKEGSSNSTLHLALSASLFVAIAEAQFNARLKSDRRLIHFMAAQNMNRV